MSARECDCRAEHHSGIHIPRCAIYAGPPPDHDDALWTDLMSAMTGVLGSDDESIDLSTDLLEAIRPHIDREVRDAERLRNLAAWFDTHPRWSCNYSGAEIAAMLRGDGA